MFHVVQRRWLEEVEQRLGGGWESIMNENANENHAVQNKENNSNTKKKRTERKKQEFRDETYVLFFSFSWTICPLSPAMSRIIHFRQRSLDSVATKGKLERMKSNRQIVTRFWRLMSCEVNSHRETQSIVRCPVRRFVDRRVIFTFQIRLVKFQG